MKNIIASLAFAFVGLAFMSCEDVPESEIIIKEPSSNVIIDPSDLVSKSEDVAHSKRLECPKTSDDSNCQIVAIEDEDGKYGTNYFVEWDCNKRAQRWTAYQLFKANLAKNVSRSDNFYEDTTSAVAAYRSTLADYKSSGFDRGHMCPSADRLCSRKMNQQTFCLLNMHPQMNGLNAGMWAEMESRVRTWATTESFCDTLYVVKGGTIADNQIWSKKTHGDYGLVVPKYFFMALLAVKNGSYKALGFWIEHKEGKSNKEYTSEDKAAKNMKNYIVTIDQLETFTGIDFFYNLDTQIQDLVEKQTIISDWNF